MGLKTILVCLTTEMNAESLMKAAVGLARKHDAHLIGLHTLEALMVYPGIAMHVPGPAFSYFNDSQKAQAKAIEAVWKKYTDHEDFICEWRFVKAESTTAADRMVESARAADLIIVSQADPEHDRFDQTEIQQKLIRRSGRPVLMIPLGYDRETLGKKVVVGWSDTREATRAAHDMLDVVEAGASVNIVRAGVSKDDLADYSANELAEMYDRHGLKATTIHREPDGLKVSEILEKEALEAGADMIVTGAFGHSRTYDFVIGAVTRDLLSDTKYPTLFSK